MLCEVYLLFFNDRCPVVVKVHKDCLKKLEKRLPKSLFVCMYILGMWLEANVS